jgi:hypothetical protein
MKKNTRNILLLVVVIVVAVVFLKRRVDGFLSDGYGWWRNSLYDNGTGKLNFCPAGYQTYIYANKTRGKVNNAAYICGLSTPVTFNQIAGSTNQSIKNTNIYANKGIKYSNGSAFDISNAPAATCGVNESYVTAGNMERSEFMILEGMGGDDITFREWKPPTNKYSLDGTYIGRDPAVPGLGIIGFKCSVKTAAQKAQEQAQEQAKKAAGIRPICLDNNILKPELNRSGWCTTNFVGREHINNSNKYTCTNTDINTVPTSAQAVCIRPGYTAENIGKDAYYSCYDCVKAPNAPVLPHNLPPAPPKKPQPQPQPAFQLSKKK